MSSYHFVGCKHSIMHIKLSTAASIYLMRRTSHVVYMIPFSDQSLSEPPPNALVRLTHNIRLNENPSSILFHTSSFRLTLVA